MNSGRRNNASGWYTTCQKYKSVLCIEKRRLKNEASTVTSGIPFFLAKKSFFLSWKNKPVGSIFTRLKIIRLQLRRQYKYDFFSALSYDPLGPAGSQSEKRCPDWRMLFTSSPEPNDKGSATSLRTRSSRSSDETKGSYRSMINIHRKSKELFQYFHYSDNSLCVMLNIQSHKSSIKFLLMNYKK